LAYSIYGVYAITTVWEKFSGIPLSKEYFWNLDRIQQNSIREEFRRIFE